MQKNNSGAATRKDVAELAGVSPPTVSLVLNNNPGTRISEETRQRVIDAAKKLKYRPSPIARALVCGRTMTIGVVLHHVRDPFSGFTTAILDGFWLALEENGYRLVLATGKQDQTLAGLYRERSVDGIAVLASPYNADDEELKDAVSTGFPTIFIGSRPAKFTVDYIDIDNRAAGYWATEELLAAGHRKILHITGPCEANSSAVERQLGYEDALKKAGIKIDKNLIIFGSYNPTIAAESLKETLNKGVKFTGIFAANHAMGVAATEVLREYGLRVPEDVSVTAIDRDNATSHYHPSLTRLGLPLHDIGRTACNTMLNRITDSDSKPEVKFLPPEIINGESIAPPPQ